MQRAVAIPLSVWEDNWTEPSARFEEWVRECAMYSLREYCRPDRASRISPEEAIWTYRKALRVVIDNERKVFIPPPCSQCHPPPLFNFLHISPPPSSRPWCPCLLSSSRCVWHPCGMHAGSSLEDRLPELVNIAWVRSVLQCAEESPSHERFQRQALIGHAGIFGASAHKRAKAAGPTQAGAAHQGVHPGDGP